MRREKQKYMKQEYLQPKRFLIILSISFICFSIYGCSRAVIEPQPIEDKSKSIQIKEEPIKEPEPQYKRGVKPYDQYEFKKPIDYFGKVPSYPLHKLTSEAQYPDFERDIYGKEGLKRALKQSIIYYNRVPKSTKFYFGDDKYDAAFMSLSAKRFLDFLERSPSTKRACAIKDHILRNNHPVIYLHLR